MDTKVPISRKEAEEILSKVSLKARMELHGLTDLDPYIDFLIMQTPEWYEKYMEEFDFWLAMQGETIVKVS